ncbi:50S ribosomal protein L4 [Candidatus Wolfebacteria bacterium CG10_big_fil_rev_8_21_14_0_10_31_9]|uniref:Large ribosomal subunit protein uL4 n=1 Tax=Candidatus Wolfebacteria bacterium CG10_big_fil_rev_8_21_14_0_10_31_9 TaxID=1975070 RepID=A0A2H0RCE4_9BACT|nr:MAG: 50S ribosomal protein L4 [Candidatus Wolfebacteria bacterium CG10_big_fil_rev_8_21_14_0_10_31_9]
MKVDILNIKNEKAGTLDVSDKIFGLKWNPELVHQAVVAHLANAREPWAHTKGRGEVRGGGKKPWKQKGTGRARHGSSRSPIWVGGGVTHGPIKERDFSKKINKKMKRLAIFSVLSKKFKDSEIKIVDNFDGIENKSKAWAGILKNLTDLRSKTLVILEDKNKSSIKSISNIKNADTISPISLNVYDLMKCKNIILESNAVLEIEKTYKV